MFVSSVVTSYFTRTVDESTVYCCVVCRNSSRAKISLLEYYDVFLLHMQAYDQLQLSRI